MTKRGGLANRTSKISDIKQLSKNSEGRERKILLNNKLQMRLFRCK